MPYSTPSSTATTTTTTTTVPAGRPTHRRSYTSERGPGAFASLGALPRRSAPHFHIQNDHGSSNSSSCDSDGDADERAAPPPIKFRLQLNTNSPIPFPRSSPSPSPLPSPSLKQNSYLRRPPSNRTSSSPILLSNGKPLKSSLKSSSSSPNIPALHQHSLHLRARSEPSTPAPELLSPTGSDVSTMSTPKNVHFPDHHLETVRLFNRSAKPASLLSVEDNETDSEAPRGFPFPVVPPNEYTIQFDPLPSALPSRDVILESISMDKLTLKGSLLVRNVSFEKHVHVRFTLDDWQTTSEVAGRYNESLPFLPLAKPSVTVGDVAAGVASDPWDRFDYSIRLQDYAPSLGSRTMYLVVRYNAAGGEWWDNNNGKNYRVQFDKKSPPPPTTSTVPFPSVSLPSVTPATPPLTPPTPNHDTHARTTSAEALEKRLRGFKLANYAKPASPTISSPPIQISTISQPIPAPDSPSTPTLSNSSSDEDDEDEEALSPLVERPRTEIPATLPYSVLGSASPPKSPPASMVRKALPPRTLKSPSPSPPSSSEDLYKAFVQKWCFVGGVGA